MHLLKSNNFVRNQQDIILSQQESNFCYQSQKTNVVVDLNILPKVFAKNIIIRSIMKPRSQISQIIKENIVHRQKSSRKQFKYIKNHQTTSPPDIGRDNITLPSSISIKQCIHRLNLYSNQNLPLSYEVVQALKNYLNEVGLTKAQESRKWTSLHKSQKSLHKAKDNLLRSPYFSDGVLYKQHAFTQKQKENLDVFRKNLQKKKMNYENREINIFQEQKNLKLKCQENIKLNILDMKNTIQTLQNQLNQFRQTAKSTFAQLFNHVQTSLKQILEEERRKKEQIYLLSLEQLKKYREKQEEYEYALQQEKQNFLRAKDSLKILRDYLQQREKELLTMWSTINSNSLSL